MSNIRVRFAPSPTGYLHVGGLRTALYNYLFARSHNGRFILRIEDTDQARYVPGAEESLIAALRIAGLAYDEGPDLGGDKGPYRQSERIDIYKRYVMELVDKGHAYFAFDSPEELDEMRKHQEKSGLPTKYDRRALKLSPDEVKARLADEVPHVIRMKVPDGGVVAFNDIVRGRVEFATDQIDDQVLLKSDGYPTYHLANVVDDHLMEISHVIRGEEWLPSTPKHVLLYRFLGWDLPQFAHLPLLLNPDKSKLSKRQGDVAVEDYLAKGYLPEALVNFVAFLGWNPGDDREIFSLDELVKEFTLERVGKSGAVFNLEKLRWMNGVYLRMKDDASLVKVVKDELQKSRYKNLGFNDYYLMRVVQSMKERVEVSHDFVEKCTYFYEAPTSYDPDVLKKRWKPASPEHLGKLVEAFSALRDPAKEDYENALHQTATELNVGNGQLIHPLRLAVSGTGSGPGLYDILQILGKDEVLRRIRRAIETIKL